MREERVLELFADMLDTGTEVMLGVERVVVGMVDADVYDRVDDGAVVAVVVTVVAPLVLALFEALIDIAVDVDVVDVDVDEVVAEAEVEADFEHAKDQDT